MQPGVGKEGRGMSVRPNWKNVRVLLKHFISALIPRMDGAADLGKNQKMPQ